MYPWALPIQALLVEEERSREARKAEEQALLLAKIEEEKKRAEQVAAEAKQWDETILRLCRNDVMKGLGFLAKTTQGIDKLCERLCEQLIRGTDSQGKPFDLPAGQVLQLIQRYSTSVKALSDAASALVAIERVKANLPTAIVALDVATITVEDAMREVEIAQHAVDRAKRLGLSVVQGGKASNG